MRIVFCGSGPFAVRSLRVVAAGRDELAAVLTQPARPAGRGGKLRATPVAEACRQDGLEFTECPDINAPEAVAALAALHADVMCVVDFGQLIRRPARQAVRLAAFNLHGSLLPELRGAAPVNWAIIRGLGRTGVTTFDLVDQMDAGPVYLQAATEIAPDETADELRDRLAGIGAGLVCMTLDLLEGPSAHPREQDHSKASLAPRLKKSDGIIDWSADSVSVRDLIHGTWSWPAAQARFIRSDGNKVDLVISRAAAEQAGGHPSAVPGTIDADLCVACGCGRLRILELKPAGKRLMGWSDFVNGYRVREGDRFVAIEP